MKTEYIQRKSKTAVKNYKLSFIQILIMMYVTGTLYFIDYKLITINVCFYLAERVWLFVPFYKGYTYVTGKFYYFIDFE